MQLTATSTMLLTSVLVCLLIWLTRSTPIFIVEKCLNKNMDKNKIRNVVRKTHIERRNCADRCEDQEIIRRKSNWIS